MPRGDGTGPDGQGARTGRGLGTCDIDEVSDSNAGRVGRLNRGRGQGLGQGVGRGGGIGRGNRGGRRRGR